ncbi:hypothetical protein [Moorena sp. SIO3I6]|uniref:hypothetical protein n=1 Tax=Moorena sp. SIO3I6 TaxID=2607831 RepID=UPI0013FC7318|nr:hypothetical protein [Moorena sp. SIO3I6]NEP21150.1 hypothetical protein [Moorena sp. SIO3I6]
MPLQPRSLGSTDNQKLSLLEVSFQSGKPVSTQLSAISYQPLALAVGHATRMATLREQFMGYTHATRSVLLNKIS